jgi:L-fuconolactonase
MQRIDSHQHFWKFNPVRDSWITEEMSVIQRDFLPNDLQILLQEENIEGCVAVQADQSEDQNHFLLKLAAENSFIKGIVGWVDLQAENVKERLNYYKQFPIIKGFRHVLQNEEDKALMLKPHFKRGIAALKEFNFTYDILIFTHQLKYAKELVALFPAQKFVIDHLAKPAIKNKEINEWAKDIQAIADHPNVYCKVSGMVTEAKWKGWVKSDFTPYLEVVAEAFGMKRLLYGSDWPVCLVSASYHDMISMVADYFSSFSRTEQDQFFGQNAIQFYNL